MFGKRSDGYLVRDIDPVIALTPYIMPMRCDAQVMFNYRFNWCKNKYIVIPLSTGYFS